MAENDPFAALDTQPSLQSVIAQEVINPIPGNSLLTIIETLTEFEKGLLIAFILIYLLQEM